MPMYWFKKVLKKLLSAQPKAKIRYLEHNVRDRSVSHYLKLSLKIQNIIS